MTRGRRWRGRAALAVAVASWLLLLAAGPSSASAPARTAAVAGRPGALAEGVKADGVTTFTLDPQGGAVHVAVDLTLTNQRPDQVTGGYTQRYYLPSFGVPVLSEAVGLAAVTSGGNVLPVSTEATDTPRFVYAVVDLRPDLYYPSSQTFRLSYDLPRVAPRSAALSRLNDAYATFPMLAIGDQGHSAVEVIIPEGFEVEVVGDDMEESERDGQQVFTATAIPDPPTWFVQVSARDDTKLVDRTVALGDQEVRVLGWPDDPEWADFTAAQVADGVPAIEAVLGVAWPATSRLEVVETASPYLYGYAGWYVRNGNLIEVGDRLDQQVILHELSHLWFNDTLFEERWINEAFANQVAALAMHELGVQQPKPENIDPADPGALKLNDWSAPDLQAELSDEQERYGYNASWAVLDAIGAEIGEGLAAVVQAADAGQPAYPGPGDTGSTTHVYDWRELLDLLEGVGGSTTATELFQRHVVDESEAADFEPRAAARARYTTLLDAGDGWAAPRSVRQAMTDWRFETAEDLMVGATEVLATKADLLEVAADLDVSQELALREAYEGASDMAGLGAEAEDALDAARALQSAEDAEASGAGPLGAIGLLFSSVEEHLVKAATSFDEGDYKAVRADTAMVESTLDEAARTGLVRLVGLALLFLVGVLLWRARRTQMARRAAARQRAADELEADGAESVGSPTDGRGEGGV